MSLKAMLWVMEKAPAKNHTELAVLYALADRADDQGGSCFPSQDWIADKARCSKRTVGRILGELHARGIIRHGDHRHVAHIRADRRPTVWHIDLTQDRHTPAPTPPGAPGEVASTGGQDDTPLVGDDGVTGSQDDVPSVGSRVDTGGATGRHPGSHGWSPVVARVDTAMSNEPSLTPSNRHEPPNPPLSPQGESRPGVGDFGDGQFESVIVEEADSTSGLTPPPRPPVVPGEVWLVGPSMLDPIPVGADDPVAKLAEVPASSSKSKRGSRLPEDFQPSPRAVSKIRDRYPAMDRDFFEREFEKFKNHWLSSSGRNATKLDWDRAWMNWMHTAVDRLPGARRAAMYGSASAGNVVASEPSKQSRSHDIAAALAAEFASSTPSVMRSLQ